MTDKFAVIGGSGAYNLLKDEGFGVDLECRKLFTPFGESASIHRFTDKDIIFLFISRHGENGYEISAPFVNYRANIWALKECGVERIISWSGQGIINKRYSVGDFVIPHDIIDESKGRDYTFFNGTGIGYIRQSHPFCTEIRDTLSASLEETGESYHNEGVYVCTQGPRLETSEERSYKEGELFEGMQNKDEKERVDKIILKFPEIIKRTFKKLSQVNRGCPCKNAMGRYKRRGDIGEDWRTWIRAEKKKLSEG